MCFAKASFPQAGGSGTLGQSWGYSAAIEGMELEFAESRIMESLIPFTVGTAINIRPFNT